MYYMLYAAYYYCSEMEIIACSSTLKRGTKLFLFTLKNGRNNSFDDLVYIQSLLFNENVRVRTVERATRSRSAATVQLRHCICSKRKEINFVFSFTIVFFVSNHNRLRKSIVNRWKKRSQPAWLHFAFLFPSSILFAYILFYQQK